MVCRYTGTVGITGGCCPPDERRTCSEMICFILDTASDKHKSVRFRFTPSQHERAAMIVTNVTLSSVKSVCGCEVTLMERFRESVHTHTHARTSFNLSAVFI